MKYLVLIGDGMSDWPLKQLRGMTPLEAAKTPNLDFLAQNGTCGWVKNIPAGMEPGSDVAAMSIFGYDPKKFYTGRGPLEAASLGIKLKKNEVAFRCNLVSIAGGKMDSFTAHHIKTGEARKIMNELDRKIGGRGIKFYPGVSYRHLLVIDESKVQSPMSKVGTVPPHDITGKKIGPYLPRGKGAGILLRLINESEVVLHGMKTKATMIWPWGQGRAPQLPSLRKRYGVKGAVITAVHLLKGLGKTIGMESIDVPGATGYLDTNYQGKAEYALRALKKKDVVFVHVEAPDETGHEGSIKKKIKAIEDFDRLVVGTIMSKVSSPKSNVRILVLPDHPTPIKIMTHSAEAVPFVVYPSRDGGRGTGMEAFSEREIKKSKLVIGNGYGLLGKFIGGKI